MASVQTSLRPHPTAPPVSDPLAPIPGDSRLSAIIEHRAQILVGIALTAIVVGDLLHLLGEGTSGQSVRRVAITLIATELAVEVGRSIVVERGPRCARRAGPGHRGNGRRPPGERRQPCLEPTAAE